MKKIITIALVIALICCAGGFFALRGTIGCISREEAMKIAMENAKLTAPQLTDSRVNLQSSKHATWYSVGLNAPGVEFDYRIDAVSGSILSLTMAY